MIVLLITGIVCYASFTSPVPDNPVRLMFQNKAGKVLFTHLSHTDNYSLECLDCQKRPVTKTFHQWLMHFMHSARDAMKSMAQVR